RHVFFALLEHRWLFLISIIYFLMFLYVGDRGPIMQLGITYLLCYTLFQKRISFVKLFTIIIVGATFFTIIEYGRTRDATYREGNILTVGYDNFTKSDTQFNPTNELATSVRILYRALDVVPDYHPFLY